MTENAGSKPCVSSFAFDQPPGEAWRRCVPTAGVWLRAAHFNWRDVLRHSASTEAAGASGRQSVGALRQGARRSAARRDLISRPAPHRPKVSGRDSQQEGVCFAPTKFAPVRSLVRSLSTSGCPLTARECFDSDCRADLLKEGRLSFAPNRVFGVSRNAHRPFSQLNATASAGALPWRLDACRSGLEIGRRGSGLALRLTACRRPDRPTVWGRNERLRQ